MHTRANELKLGRTRQLLADAADKHAPAVFTSSFGAEDMVLMDLIARDFRGIEIATLDTGRLPPETCELIERAAAHYRCKVKVYFPRHDAVERYVGVNGLNGFYHGVAQRKSCCEVRKVEPLERALAGRRAWITGLRREQSVTRLQLKAVALDADRGLYKFNPLADWSDDDVWAYIRTRKVPYNVLHDRGYPSIGCAPCTRAVAPGEDQRARRWWWEAPGNKECGLHPRKEAA